jgi:hypothetical protein
MALCSFLIGHWVLWDSFVSDEYLFGMISGIGQNLSIGR